MSKKSFFKTICVGALGFGLAKIHTRLQNNQQEKNSFKLFLENNLLVNLPPETYKIVKEMLEEPNVEDELFDLFTKKETRQINFNKYETLLTADLAKVKEIDKNIYLKCLLMGCAMTTNIGGHRRSQNFKKFIESHTGEEIVNIFATAENDIEDDLLRHEKLMEIMNTELTIAERAYNVITKANNKDDVEIANSLLSIAIELNNIIVDDAKLFFDFINKLPHYEKNRFKKNLYQFSLAKLSELLQVLSRGLRLNHTETLNLYKDYGLFS